ncbi:putative MRPL23-mitochondrial ribosomal protein, large subunit [Serendipita vermifera]|nr:putative MRPL23-mitochondrial ribosomal protein, large subunit [Serendipita vermifera]
MSQAIGNPRLAYMRLWHHADASGRILGKFATRIANVLMGKHKPVWHPSLDYGDYVVVTNVRKLLVTGKKEDQIVYRHHTMFPGGLHERKYRDLMDRKPDEILRLAVSGMLPKNKLRDRRLERLRIFEGDEIEGGLEGNLLSSWGSLKETRPPTFTPTPPSGSNSTTQTSTHPKASTTEARRRRRRQAEA